MADNERRCFTRRDFLKSAGLTAVVVAEEATIGIIRSLTACTPGPTDGQVPGSNIHPATAEATTIAPALVSKSRPERLI